MKERRKYPRVSFDRNVLWRGPRTFDNLHRAKNASECGLCLVVGKQELDVGEIIQLQTQLPTNVTFHSRAKVVWARPDHKDPSKCNVGLTFLEISDSDRYEMCHFVGVCRYGCD